MDFFEAQDRFELADELYRKGQYAQALDQLSNLEKHYPDNYRVLNAKARTLAKLGKLQPALAIYDRLLDEFHYEKIRSRRDQLANAVAMYAAKGDTSDKPGPPPLPKMPLVAAVVPPPMAAPPDPPEIEVLDDNPKKRRFRIKPIRLLLLIAIIVGMALDYVPYWLGGGLIVGYFLMKFMIRAAMYRLFTIPFKMKGKALAGAIAEVHGWEWTDKPAAGLEDEDGEGEPEEDLRYVWVDVTITPPDRSEGFVYWEPGELALIPSNVLMKKLDDHDHCLQVRAVRFIRNGEEVEDEGEKVGGAHRIKLLAALPPDKHSFRFVYYFEVFGEVNLT